MTVIHERVEVEKKESEKRDKLLYVVMDKDLCQEKIRVIEETTEVKRRQQKRPLSEEEKS